MGDQQKGYLYALLAGSLWGIQGIFIKLMDQAGASSGQISFCRAFFSFVILCAVGLAAKGKKAFCAPKRTIVCCMFMGLFWQLIFNFAYNYAINTVGMAVGAVLLNISPVFFALISRALFKERFTWLKIAALLLNVTGCALAATGGDFSGASVSLIGIAMGILAALMYTISAIIGRFASEGSDQLTVNIYMFFFASIFIGTVFRPWEGIAAVSGAKFWASGALYALLSTVLAFMLYLKAISTIKETSKAPVFASVEIVVAALMGALVFHEGIGVTHMIGMAMVFSSIYMMNSSKPVKG